MRILLLTLLCFTVTNVLAQTQCAKGNYCYLELFGSSLNITLDADATVSLSLFTSLDATANLPSGFTSLVFSASVGFTLDVQPPSAAILSARFVTPQLSLASQAALVTGARVGCLQYDSNIKWYNEFSVDSVDTGTKKIVVNFPSSGTYVFAIVSASATLPALYNKQRDVPSNKTQEIRYPYGLFLQLTSQFSNKLNVSYYQQNPKGIVPQGKVAYGKFWNFAATTENNLEAIIKVTYNKSEVLAKGIVEESLRLAFYNEVSGQWEFLSTGGSVDVQSSTVIQVTPHFSTWAVYGESSAANSLANHIIVNLLMMITLAIFAL